MRIALYAIDSLKQLAIKYLSRGELAHYNFQKEFLKPFEDIFSKNHSVKIRDIVTQFLFLKSKFTKIILIKLRLSDVSQI